MPNAAEDIAAERTLLKAVLYDIVWDTDGESVDLPEKVVVEDPPDEMIAAIRDGRSDELSDYLSNVYGWCVYEFDARLSPTN